MGTVDVDQFIRKLRAFHEGLTPEERQVVATILQQASERSPGDEVAGYRVHQTNTGGGGGGRGAVQGGGNTGGGGGGGAATQGVNAVHGQALAILNAWRSIL
jgi:hypothetical protein